MDGRRDETLTDESLDREIEALFDVDPPPSFAARTRARLDVESTGAGRPLWMTAPRWRTATVAGVAAVMAGAVVLWPIVWPAVRPTAGPAVGPVTSRAPVGPQGGLPPVAPPGSTSGATTDAGLAEADLRVARVEEVVAPARPPERSTPVEAVPPPAATGHDQGEAVEPEVLVPAGEARGFAALVARLDQGLLDGSMLPEDWGRRAEDSRVVIDVMPIEIVPLMPPARPEGERP